MTEDKPIHVRLSDRMTALVGRDIAVSFDDRDRPSWMQVHRHDPIADELMREALGRMASEFPETMRAITTVVVSFEGDLGRSRRRVDPPWAS